MKDHNVEAQGFDVNPDARKKAEENGIKTFETLEALTKEEGQNVIWVMLPAGPITNSTHGNTCRSL